MLTCDEVLEIFKAHVPENVTVVAVPRLEFVSEALRNPFIQQQVALGIYDNDNIWNDFLSPACAYANLKRLEVCYDLLCDHAEGVTDEETIVAHITMMAFHEAHHFHVDNTPDDADGHAEAELDCIRETTAAHPDLSDKSEQFEHESVVHQRVYDRISLLHPKAFS